jgi:Secretion system C-terminal sorting domain/Cleaved Adhesin Domain
MHKSVLLFLIALSTQIASAQTFLMQEDFSGGIPAGWQVIDNDGNPLHSSLSQFTDAWISYETSTDTSIASASFFDDTLQASDYLILPKQSLLTFSKLSWEARSVDASYPDSYYVLLSTTDSNLTSFTDTLMTVFGEFYQWIRHSVLLDTMGFANQDVFIAFKNFTSEGYILELDDIWLEVSDFASIPTSQENDFLLYPNPTSQFITVAIKEPFSAFVYNTVGQIVLESTSKQIDVSSLVAGRYFIQVMTASGVSAQPFIKL